MVFKLGPICTNIIVITNFFLQEKDEDAAYMSHVAKHKTGVDFKYRGPMNEAEVMLLKNGIQEKMNWLTEIDSTESHFKFKEESGGGNKENEMAAKFKSGMGKEVKAHHILVLLLRLRQVITLVNTVDSIV